MKKKTLALISAAALLAIILPFVAVPLIGFLTPAVYDNSFVGALDEKYERLTSLEEDKIIVVGGSSVAFGLDSRLLEEYTGMPVVNFGLYADLGTKLMMDLSRDGISEGDVVVLAPELDAQTLSLFFSSKNTLMAMDGSYGMMWSLPIDDILSMLGGSWDFTAEKLNALKGEKPNPEGVYNSKHFDEYGDLRYPREENEMLTYRDENRLVDLTPEALDNADFREFCDYVNDYVSYCKRKGAAVYFSWCPVNDRGLGETVTEESIAAFSKVFEDSLDCPVISELGRYILDAGYFYDTNFHLNDTGVKLRTMRLAKDIRFAHDIVSGIVPSKEPEAPDLPLRDVNFGQVDANDVYFTYELTSYGSYAISGLTEEGKKMKELTLPVGYGGKLITEVGRRAFAFSDCEKIIITADSKITILHNGVTEGASKLRELWIYLDSGTAITPPLNFAGAANGFTIHTKASAGFRTDYTWYDFRPIIVEDAEEN